MRKLVLGFVLAIVVATGLSATIAAAGNTCVLHKGSEIWVDDSSIGAHLGHGDALC